MIGDPCRIGSLDGASLDGPARMTSNSSAGLKTIFASQGYERGLGVDVIAAVSVAVDMLVGVIVECGELLGATVAVNLMVAV